MTYNSNSAIIDSFAYTYNAAGEQISSTSHLGGTVNNAYDPNGQVTSSGANSFTWDAEGNPTGSGFTVNADNALTATPTNTLSYDNEGELIENTTTATGDTWFYAYNNAGQMISAQEYTAASSGTLEQSIVYQYDVFGNRVSESVTVAAITTTTLFAYDGWNPAKAGATGNSGFELWATVAQGPFGLESISTRYMDGDAVNQVFARIDSTLGPAWLLSDDLGSIRDVTDGSGNIRNNIQYSAFGEVLSETQFSSGGSPTTETPQTDQWGGNIGFAGMMLDLPTGLYYDDARDYSPSLRRFESQDPTGLGGGSTNLYTYVANDPTDATDPSGLLEQYTVAAGSTTSYGPAFGTSGGLLGDQYFPSSGNQLSNVTGVNWVNGAMQFNDGSILTTYGNGSFTFIAGNQPGTDTFGYTVTNSGGQQTPGSATINIVNNGQGLTGSQQLSNSVINQNPPPNGAGLSVLYNPTPSTFANVVVSLDYVFGNVNHGWVAQTGNLGAGAADTITLGLTRRIRRAGNFDTVNYNSGFYTAGQVIGVGVNVGLCFANPCGLSSVYQNGLLLINGVQAVAGSVNFIENVQNGDYAAAALDALGVMGNFSQLSKACFSGDTKLMARGPWGKGWRRIDQIGEGDEVLSRDEHDVRGPLEWKKVEELFQRFAFVAELRVGGRVIKTTTEHPFYVQDKGWLPAGEMMPGDMVASHDGQWVRAEEVFDTGKYEKVYNLRIADYHTYFVGGEEWGFSAWAHNAYEVTDLLAGATAGKVSKSAQYSKSGGMSQATKDFDALTAGLTVKDHGGGIRSAVLADGSTVSVRPLSTQGSPTIQLNPATGKPVKVRYD